RGISLLAMTGAKTCPQITKYLRRMIVFSCKENKCSLYCGYGNHHSTKRNSPLHRKLSSPRRFSSVGERDLQSYGALVGREPNQTPASTGIARASYQHSR